MTDQILLLLNSVIVQDPQQVQDLTSQLATKHNISTVKRQVLDRVIANQVKLEDETYQVIHVTEPDHPLSSTELSVLHNALRSGGWVEGTQVPQLDAILAGFVVENEKYIKVVKQPQTFELKKRNGASSGAKRALPVFKKLQKDIVKLSLDDDSLDESDDELVDENSLISQPLSMPIKCDLRTAKKRRKACKDCTCGLKEELQREEGINDNVVTINVNDDDEIDFTIPGKTGGSCGNCALGDAFRCDGCPYIGLPPFKPGEIVNISALKGDF